MMATNSSFDILPFLSASKICISSVVSTRTLSTGFFLAASAVVTAPATSSTPANAMMFRVIDILSLLDCVSIIFFIMIPFTLCFEVDQLIEGC